MPIMLERQRPPVARDELLDQLEVAHAIFLLPKHGRQDTLHLPLGELEQGSRFGCTHLSVENPIQYHYSFLVLRVQGDCLLHSDIFTEHLPYDNITER